MEKTMLRIADIQTKGCSFDWEKLKELKENKVEFYNTPQKLDRDIRCMLACHYQKEVWRGSEHAIDP